MLLCIDSIKNAPSNYCFRLQTTHFIEVEHVFTNQSLISYYGTDKSFENANNNRFY